MRTIHKSWFVVIFFLAATPFLQADTLDDLARDFWNWRAAEQPVSTDDIPRLQRPAGWVPDWSPEAVAGYRLQLDEFESRWKKIDPTSWSIPRKVDYRLMGSAVARVRWELDLTRSWQRNPLFYLDQTVGAYFDFLLAPPPFDPARTRHIVAILGSIPRTLENGKQNLTQPVRPFAALALDRLQDIRPRFLKSVRELKPNLDAAGARDFDAVAEKAVAALEAYRDWLAQRLYSMPTETEVGRENYVFFLKNVALLPYTPEKLLEIGREEWARSVAFQTYEEHRNVDQLQLAIFKDESEQIAREQKDELEVRRYLETHDILTVPAWVQHYTFRPLPDYLAPLSGVGEDDDFTGASRLKENATRYIPPPGPNLGYFGIVAAKDTRPGIVHEGVPGHYFQLVLSWAHPDPIRRHYYDSSANEGIGFYAEEMMLEAGLFDDSPRTREIICNFMRLRALRVGVDVKLALGQFTIPQAADYLQTAVPMDAGTAKAEAAFFASMPGQAISYQIGKFQIVKFLADARRQQGEKFSLRSFHDFVWQNGNVPISLQTWELLRDQAEIKALEEIH